MIGLITNNEDYNYRNEEASWSSSVKTTISSWMWGRPKRSWWVVPNFWGSHPPSCAHSTGAPSSVLTSCITVWYGSCTASCRKILQCMWIQLGRSSEPLCPTSVTFSTPTSPSASPLPTSYTPSFAFREMVQEPPGPLHKTVQQLHRIHFQIYLSSWVEALAAHKASVLQHILTAFCAYQNHLHYCYILCCWSFALLFIQSVCHKLL